jgi:hypothetical protein
LAASFAVALFVAAAPAALLAELAAALALLAALLASAAAVLAAAALLEAAVASSLFFAQAATETAETAATAMRRPRAVLKFMSGFLV